MWATEPNFTPEELQGITVPVMVIDGLEEEAILIPHAEEMAGLIPGAELVLMEDIGHFAMWDKTAEFNAHMLEFLGK
jgi:pimeloyl-ACP methyl ester carboxylesterase